MPDERAHLGHWCFRRKRHGRLFASLARDALRVLGVERHDFLDARDGSLADAVPATGERLAAILAQWQPDVVMLPFMSDRHADHFAANRCLVDAAARLGTACDRLECMAYESWSPLHANLYVDITPSVEAKRQAIRCHASQLAFEDYVAAIEGLNRYRAMAGRVRGTHAEAFFVAAFPDYRRLLARMPL
ncbi:MAG TPA: PIG-L family deacetylase [Usitatibacter sp.]|nr:PIG-L family deacetylase [Usitatibacter sp.]